MDKFIVQKDERNTEYRPIMVDSVVHEKLWAMKEVTGVSIGKLVGQMVDFCTERLTVTK